jgi:hypothetical protein
VRNLPYFVILLRKLALLALTGLMAVILIGPILAVLGILFSFAVIGMIFWLPVRTLILGKPVEWAHYRRVTQRCGRAVLGGWQHVSAPLAGPGQMVLDRVRATGRFLATVCRETLCGAFVGAMLALTLASPNMFFLWPVLFGFAFGALAGAVVGLCSGRRVWETAM